MKKRINNSSYIERRLLGTNNRYFIPAFASVFLLDLVSIILLIVSGTTISYIAPTIVFAIVDLAFLGIFASSNPRMKYSLIQYISYAIVSFIVLITASIIYFFDFHATIMSITAWIFFMLSHLFVIGAIGKLSFVCKDDSSRIKKGQVVATIATSIIAAIVYIVYISVNGYFGQGNTGRNLIFDYKEDSGTYKVAGIVPGNGRSVSIPEIFNGKKVTEISLDILNDENLSKIVLNDDNHNVTFVDYETIDENKNYGVEICTYYTKVDTYKNVMLDYAGDNANRGVLSIANNVIPYTGMDGKKYVSFNYDLPAIDIINRQYLPTWIGNRGDTFNISSAGIDFFTHKDQTNNDDLIYCYENQVFDGKSFILANNSISVGSQIINNEKIDIVFDRIYKIQFANGNDTLYSGLESDKFIDASHEYRLVTSNTVKDVVFNQYHKREGFDLAFKVGDNFVDESNIVDAINDGVTINPVWSLRAPVVTMSFDNNSVTYGDSATINFSATMNNTDVNSHMTYDYKIYRGTTLVDTITNETGSSSFELSKIFPEGCTTNGNKGGAYHIQVVAHHDGSSLTSEAISSNSTLTVNKKAIVADWNTSGSLTYDGIGVTLTGSIDQGTLVEGDTIEDFNVLFVNAGTHTTKFVLTGDDILKYSVQNANHSVIIDKKTATITIDNAQKEYDGFAYSGFSYDVQGLVNGESFDDYYTLTFTGDAVGAKNANSYTIDCNIALKTGSNVSDNYEFIKNTGELTISKKNATVSWNDSSFVYSGNTQHPTATISGIANGDNASTINGLITYTGDTNVKNVGEYSITANVSKLTNYNVTNELSQEYSIEKKEIYVSLADVAKTYNGETYSTANYNVTITGLVTGESQANIFNFGFDGTAVNAVNAGTYSVSVTLSSKNDTLFNNYEVSYTKQNATLTINKKAVSISWTSNSFTYSGEVQHPTATINDLASVDSALNNSLSYTGDDSVYNCGNSYTITVDLSTGFDNYTVSNTTQTFKINQREITILWGTSTFDYDGQNHSIVISDISNAVATEKDGILSALTVTGSGTNAGSYTVTATLSGYSNYKLKVSTATKTLVINKVAITLNWNATTSFEYDGQEHFAKVDSITGAVNGESDSLYGSLIYSASKTNAGNYTTTVSLPTNSNYVISGSSSKQFTITKKAITLVWDEASTSYTYDGQAHNALVTAVNGAVSGEETSVFNSLIYSASKTNAGSYKTTVTLPSNSNYVISGSNQKDFTIAKRTITLNWDSSSLSVTYDGQFHNAYVSSVTGYCGSEDTLIMSSLSYSDSKKDAGTYVTTVTLPTSFNYEISGSNQKEFTIAKKSIVLANDGVTTNFIYDGQEHHAVVTKVNGTIASDTNSVISSLIYSQGYVNAGTYTTTISLPDNSNYKLDGTVTKEFTIAKRTISLVVDNAETYTFNGYVVGPYVVSVNNEVSGDEASILAKLNIQGKSSEVGAHTMTITLIDDNYQLDKTYEISYSIEQPAPQEN